MRAVDGSDYTLIDNAFNTQGSPIAPSAMVAAPAAQRAVVGVAHATPVATATATVAAVEVPQPRPAKWHAAGRSVSADPVRIVTASAKRGVVKSRRVVAADQTVAVRGLF